MIRTAARLSALALTIGTVVVGSSVAADAAQCTFDEGSDTCVQLTTTTCSFSKGRTTCLTYTLLQERTFLGRDYIEGDDLEVAGEVGVDCAEGDVVRLYNPYFVHPVSVSTTIVHRGKSTTSRVVSSTTTRTADEDYPVLYGTSFECLPA